jgi:hypothetical protein
MVRFRITFVFLALLVTVESAAIRSRIGSGIRKPGMPQRNLKRVTFGIVLPYSTFRQRKYNSTVLATLGTYNRARPQHSLTKKYNISYSIAMVGRKPSPTRKYCMNVAINKQRNFKEHGLSWAVWLFTWSRNSRKTRSVVLWKKIGPGLRGIDRGSRTRASTKQENNP